MNEIKKTIQDMKEEINKDMETLKNKQSKIKNWGIPRWRLEVGSRKRPSYSEISERRWKHTLQA
jgi:hypothetical protein